MPLLSSLGLPSLSQTVLAFFRAAGIASVEDFLVHDLYSLVSLASHQQQSEQYKQAVTDILVYLEDNHAMWCDGIDMLNIIQQTRSFLPTGCESLDGLLHGGLRDGMVTELVGASSSGKTQVCMQTAASAVLHGVMVSYIDTCNSFSSLRLSEMLSGLITSGKYQEQWNLERALKFVIYYRVHDAFSLLELLHRIDANFTACAEEKRESDTPKNVKLLILDSISSVVSPILSNTQVQGHALMMNCGHTLKKIANDNSICVMVTNHMVAGENGILKPALGESWRTVAHVRLALSREPASDVCNISLIKHSSIICNKKASFRLSTAGLQSL